jgi:hypothetical protein
MSDVTTSLRAQEIAERTQARQMQVHAGVAAQTAQAVFPDDQVKLSSAAQERLAEDSGAAGDPAERFRAAVAGSADDALSKVTSQLNHLMTVYGVTGSQTNLSGNKVVDALRNEVRRLAGVVDPPAIDTQVRQELNLIVRQMEVKVALKDELEAPNPNPVSVEFGLATLEYSGADTTVGSLLEEPGSMGSDAAGNAVDLSTVNNGLFFTASGAGAAADGGAAALDRFSGRLSPSGLATDAQGTKTSSLPDLNQDGARNDSDRGAVVVVRGSPRQDRQAETGVAQFVADLAVPIAVRASEAMPSRVQRRDVTD